MNEIFKQNEIAIEMIAEGHTFDDDPGFHGKIFRLTTWTFRLNHIGVNAWYATQPVHWNALEYESREEFETLRETREREREKLMNQIRAHLDGKEGTQSFTITQNVSEIFTAVLIQEEPQEATEPKKLTIAERLQRQRSMMNAMLCCMI